MQGQRKCVCEYQVLPEESVMLNADFPQSLRGPMVGQLEAYGALKLFILSSAGKEWRRRRRRRCEEEKESEGSECRERWRDGGTVLCVYCVIFLFSGRNIFSCLVLPCQVDFPFLHSLQISCSCAHSITCSVV